MINIAIDGPAGAGKSWLARETAAKLGFVYVDTGALYRALGLTVQRLGIDPLADPDRVERALQTLKVTLRYQAGEQHVWIGEEDVTGLLRSPEVSRLASAVATLPSVRAFLLETQRQVAREYHTVMDGRDIGTVILPDAAVKIFLTARDEVRAHRRYLELVQKGTDTSEEEVLQEMLRRDRQDRTRAAAPAVPAPDAVLLDNSEMNREETLEALLEIVGKTLAQKQIALPEVRGG